MRPVTASPNATHPKWREIPPHPSLKHSNFLSILSKILTSLSLAITVGIIWCNMNRIYFLPHSVFTFHRLELGIELLYTSMVDNNRWMSVFKRLKRNFMALWNNPSLLKLLFLLLRNILTLLPNDHDMNRWTAEIAFDITKAVICKQCGSRVWMFDAMNITILSQKLSP